MYHGEASCYRYRLRGSDTTATQKTTMIQRLRYVSLSEFLEWVTRGLYNKPPSPKSRQRTGDAQPSGYKYARFHKKKIFQRVDMLLKIKILVNNKRQLIKTED